jgi:hypothetical protein
LKISGPVHPLQGLIPPQSGTWSIYRQDPWFPRITSILNMLRGFRVKSATQPDDKYAVGTTTVRPNCSWRTTSSATRRRYFERALK